MPPPVCAPPLRQTVGRPGSALLAWACALCLALPWLAPAPARGANAATAVEHVIGVFAFRGKEHAAKAWQPTADYLSESIAGHRFRILPLLLGEIDEAVAAQRVEFVLTNPENYIVLEARHRITRNATLLQAARGRPLKEFGGLIFTRTDRINIRDLPDLRGRRVAGAAVNAFGAYQMQMHELLKQGVGKDDVTVVFAGIPQEKVVDAVARGAADAGFIRTGILEALAASGKIRLDDFRGLGLKRHEDFPFLCSTVLYPEWAFATQPGVDPQLANRVTVALLNLPHGGEVARAGGYHGWTAPLAYNSVHETLKALRAAPYDTPEKVSLAEIARRYEREAVVVLLLVLAALAFAIRRFHRLNVDLSTQVALVDERNASLAREVMARQRAEYRLGNENRVLELLAQEAPLPRVLLTIAELCSAEFAGAGIAIFRQDGDGARLAACAGIDDELRNRLDAAPPAGDAAALAALLAGPRRAPRVLPLRAASGNAPLGHLALLAAPDAPADEDDQRSLETYAALAALAIERWQTGETMHLSASVFQNALEGIVITDPTGRIVDVSPSFTRITGYRREEAIGQSMSLVRSGRHGADFYRDMWLHLLERGHWSGEIWNRTRDGRIMAEMLQIASVKDGQGRLTHYVGTFSDITSLKDAQSHLERLASFDTLTGLPNRGLLADRLAQALSQAQRRNRLLAICFLDLDGFKAVNDTLGHEAGDTLLREVAQRLSAAVRAGDTVARLGGDEFVLLLGDIKDVDELENAVERMLQTVAAPFDLAGRMAHISTSIGVTLYPLDDSDPETLLRHADQAMYRAKQDGRNCYHMFDTAHALAHHERILQRDRLRLAVQRNELVLHYQPRINLRRGDVEGVEALLRWEDPLRGQVAPAEFLPDIEFDDLICVIGDWVLRQALVQQREWQARGVPLAVSVNIAARQFLDPRFLPQLEALLAEFPQRPRGGLELEILESAAIEDTARMIQVIDHCRRLDVRFALDDFGTGYSSLIYLQRLPANTLKIDRSFVGGMLVSRAGLAIIEAIIGLANAFDCELVAEGIEEIDQGELLARMGCVSGQGNVIAPAMPAAEVLPWIAAYRPPPSWLEWNDVVVGTQDFPLILAEFEHRCWVRDFVAAVAGAPLRIPVAEIRDPALCEFGRWFDGRGRSRYGKSPAIAEIDDIHRQVHRCGAGMLSAMDAGNRDEAREHIAELEALSARLVEALHGLQRNEANRR